MGIGTYGFLCAATLDPGRLMRTRNPSGKILLDAVEGYGEYVGGVQQAIYDNIFTADLRAQLRQISSKSYDLLLLIDVLEHVSPPEISEVLGSCVAAARSVIVSTPLEFAHQHDIGYNELQEHRSHPSKDALIEAGLQVTIPDDASLIMFCCDDEDFVDYYRRRLRRAAIRSVLPQAVLRRAGFWRTALEGLTGLRDH